MGEEGGIEAEILWVIIFFSFLKLKGRQVLPGNSRSGKDRSITFWTWTNSGPWQCSFIPVFLLHFKMPARNVPRHLTSVRACCFACLSASSKGAVQRVCLKQLRGGAHMARFPRWLACLPRGQIGGWFGRRRRRRLLWDERWGSRHYCCTVKLHQEHHWSFYQRLQCATLVNGSLCHDRRDGVIVTILWRVDGWSEESWYSRYVWPAGL